MPIVKKGGKVKHFPYTKKGEQAAEMAAKQPGAVEVKKKKGKKNFGIGNLKKGY